MSEHLMQIVCGTCGGINVTRDAWAAWDTARQQWGLGAVFDYAYCHDCEEESSLVERAILCNPA